MTDLTAAEMAAGTLDKCDAALAELHDLCCVPNRSPRMEALQGTLRAVRADLELIEGEAAATERVIDALKDAGAEIGKLQIECCAPARMPLYADLLAGLSRTQRIVTSTKGGMEH